MIRSVQYHSFINNRISFLVYFRRLLSQRQLGSFLVREVQLRVLRQGLGVRWSIIGIWNAGKILASPAPSAATDLVGKAIYLDTCRCTIASSSENTSVLNTWCRIHFCIRLYLSCCTTEIKTCFYNSLFHFFLPSWLVLRRYNTVFPSI